MMYIKQVSVLNHLINSKDNLKVENYGIHEIVTITTNLLTCID
jgi:hypothetical protein